MINKRLRATLYLPACLLCLWWLPFSGSAQSTALDLVTCQTAAQAHHPLSQKPGLLENQHAAELAQMEVNRRPSLEWITSGSFQSENINLEFPIPNVEGVDLPLYNVQTYLEARYLILDGGLQQARTEALDAQLASQLQEVTVQQYPLYQAVQQYYFALLLLQEQEKQLELAQKNLELQQQKMEAAYARGVLLEMDLSQLKVELLRLQKKKQDLQQKAQAARAGLEQLTGLELSEATALEMPGALPATGDMNRPEIPLFDLQKLQLQSKLKLSEAQYQPKLSSFARAGVGYPNPLNFFNTDIRPYGIIGLQFNWPLFNKGQLDRQRQVITAQSALIEHQKATFLHQQAIELAHFESEVAGLQAQMKLDQEVLNLQNAILPQLEAQLNNGTITTFDYLLQTNAALQTSLELKAHEIQLLKTQYEYQLKNGHVPGLQ